MKFLKTHAENFLPYQTLDVSWDKQGLVLLDGENLSNSSYQSNGSGKSSLVNTLVYPLFGKTKNGITGDGVVNRKAGKNCFVSLTFSKGHDQYEVKRYRKHSKFKNKVFLVANGEDITQSTTAKTNQLILDTIGIDYDTFLNTVIYGQGDAPLFAQATDKGKKEILENITNIAVYRQAAELAKVKQSETEAKLQQVVTKRDSTQQNLSRIKVTAAANEDAYKRSLSQIKEYKQEVKTLLSTSQALDADLTPKVTKLEAAIKTLKQNIQRMQEPMAGDAEKQLAELNSQKIQLSMNKRQVKDKMTELGKSYKQTYTTTVCPVCGQPLNEDHRKQELNRLKGQLIELNTKFTQIDPKIADLDSAIRLQEDVREAEKEKAKTFRAKFGEYQDTLAKCQRYVQEYNNQMLQARINYEDKEKFISNFRIEEPYLFEKEIQEANQSLVDLEQEISKLEFKRDHYAQLVKSVFNQKGIPNEVIGLSTPNINRWINEFLGKLSGSDIVAKLNPYDTDAKGNRKDNLHVEVENLNGGLSYSSQSGGEQQRINIAIELALQKQQMSQNNLAVNLLAYDEPFDGLDAVGKENVIGMLNELSKEVGTIVVITQDKAFKPYFDKVWLVSKRGEDYSTFSQE